jgi:YD repeat-containing protein
MSIRALIFTTLAFSSGWACCQNRPIFYTNFIQQPGWAVTQFADGSAPYLDTCDGALDWWLADQQRWNDTNCSSQDQVCTMEDHGRTYTNTSCTMKMVNKITNSASGKVSYDLPYWPTATIWTWTKGCPAGSQYSSQDAESCECFSGYVKDPKGSSACVQLPSIAADSRNMSCGGNLSEGAFGNPIYPATGTKREIQDLISIGHDSLSLIYDTSRFAPSDVSVDRIARVWGKAALVGPVWDMSIKGRLHIGKSNEVLVDRGAGRQITFLQVLDGYWSMNNFRDKLVKLPSGGWLFYGYKEGVQDVYSEDGLLIKSVTKAGRILNYSYDADHDRNADARLVGISDTFARALEFKYETPLYLMQTPRVNEILHLGGGIKLGYNEIGNVNEITWGDGAKKTYFYDLPALPWALSGIQDESLGELSSYGYTSSGLANQTQHSGAVSRYFASWLTEPKWKVTVDLNAETGAYFLNHSWTPPTGTSVIDPYGNSISISTQLVQGMVRISGQSQPAGSGCNASYSRWNFDDNANITNRVDFSGLRTCSAYDSNRNLETTRLEGLLEADTCSADLLNYTIPANLAPDKAQRKIHTQWHPVWHLKTREAEPKRITTWVYNGQPDPLNNNALASCAPADALLPDGSKIAVLCKRYEQATNDETGNLGFAAPVLSTRNWSTTYNQHGQVLTETDPRQKRTCHQYWSDTAFEADGRGHTLGDLWRTSQMAGVGQDCTPTNMAAQAHKTTHTHYNKRGQVLRTELPNGGVEAREYHLRGWLTKVKQWASVAAADSGAPSQDTQYDYYPTGLLKQVTQADGSWQRYEYDDAHRLTDVIDSLGNKVKYTLDNAGNATQESHTDPSGVLVKAISRTYDTLGRLQSQKLGAP